MFNRKIIKYLEDWKEKRDRKPLVLRGARQVGKTCAVLLFGQKHFQDLIHINLDNIEHLRLFRQDLSLREFEDVIKIKFKKELNPSTLIFIDEIQNSFALIKLLRFFAEERRDLFVISAGSLLEAKIKKEGFSFPVGRVEFAYMYPLDFFEYLGAKRESHLLEILREFSLNDKLPENIHRLALDNFYEYVMVGGMPGIVKDYIETRDLNRLKPIYASLFTSYAEDVYKYSSLAEAKYLHYVIETAPLFAGTTITYEKFGGSNYRSREMGRTFDTLEKVMLLYQVNATKSRGLPIIPQRKRPKKLIFLDAGLVNHQMGIQEEFLNFPGLEEFYKGRIAEQIVGQSLLAQFQDTPPKIFYWAKEKPYASAELDFCFIQDGKIFGIEVKSGNVGRLKSLFSFAKEVENSVILRVYSGVLKKERIKIERKKIDLISLPFYLLPKVREIREI
jgi:hypothetical protein